MKKFFFVLLFISIPFLGYSKEYTVFEMCDYIIQKVINFYSCNKRFPKTLVEFESESLDLEERLGRYNEVTINGNGENFLVISFKKNGHDYKFVDTLKQAHFFTLLIDGKVCRECIKEIERSSEEYFFPPMMEMTNFDKDTLSSNDFVISEYSD